MHELSVATALHEGCRAELQARGGSRIESVRVEVGELSAVEPELLRYAWEAVVAEGPDAGATLAVDWIPARQTCTACGEVAERQPGTWLRLCPRCELPLRLEGGTELLIREISFVTEEERLPTEQSQEVSA